MKSITTLPLSVYLLPELASSNEIRRRTTSVNLNVLDRNWLIGTGKVSDRTAGVAGWNWTVTHLLREYTNLNGLKNTAKGSWAKHMFAKSKFVKHCILRYPGTQNKRASHGGVWNYWQDAVYHQRDLTENTYNHAHDWHQMTKTGYVAWHLAQQRLTYYYHGNIRTIILGRMRCEEHVTRMLGEFWFESLTEMTTWKKVNYVKINIKYCGKT